MKIAILQGSSQREKNPILERCLRGCLDADEHEILNFGVFPEEGAELTYVQAALCTGLLLSSGAVDFAVTGCSSGQGMMLALNSLPGVVCGYVENPADAYLFGRINGGNAVSYPLGLGFGWAGEINLKSTLTALFSEPFGIGYPRQDADRKQRDARQVMALRRLAMRPMADILPEVGRAVLKSVLSRRQVCDYVLEYGRDARLKQAILDLRSGIIPRSE